MDSKQEKREQALRRRRRRNILLAVIVIAAVAAAVILAGGRQYGEYKVLRSDRQDDTLTSRYGRVGGFILQYETDGARLWDRQGEEIWNISYTMTDPAFVTCGETAAIYDKGGTAVVVTDRNGKRGEFTTKLPIVRVSVSEEGNVAALQEDENNAWIEYYSSAGTEIASIRTAMDDPGYPMGISISPNGELLAVSYLSFKGGIQKGVVHVYSFGEEGQNQMDNRIAAFDFNQRVVPEVDYLDNKTLVVFRDNGFTICEGARIPEVSEEVTVDREIRAVFHDETHVGLLMTGDEEDTWQMCLYGKSGRQQFSETIDFPWSRVELYQNEISLYNGAALRVYDSSGGIRYDGVYALEPRSFFAIGKHRYVVVTETGIDVIQLKGH